MRFLGYITILHKYRCTYYYALTSSPVSVAPSDKPDCAEDVDDAGQLVNSWHVLKSIVELAGVEADFFVVKSVGILSSGKS